MKGDGDKRQQSDSLSAKHPTYALLRDSLQGRLDPFNILGSVGLPEYALHVLDFGKHGGLRRVFCKD